MKNFIFLAGQIFILAQLPLSAQADIYQWKDAEGKTQYSDQPPMDRPARLIKSGGGAPAAAAAEKTADTTEKDSKKGPKTINDQDQDYRKRKIEAEKAEKEAATKLAEKKAQCLSAKNELKDVEEYGRIYQRDEKGEKKYMDDKQRDKYASEVNARVKKSCA